LAQVNSDVTGFIGMKTFRSLSWPAPAIGVVLFCMLWAVPACRTPGALSSPVDLREPGWIVRAGQAVWQTPGNGPELAGDLLLATRDGTSHWVQFTKGALPLVMAQSTPAGWKLEVPAEDRVYSGRGQPPARLVFLNLARVLAGGSPPAGWSWTPLADGGWRLENRRTGERLEGYLEASHQP
jgi:hypothetical protein